MTDRNREVQERFGANVETLRRRAGLSVDALAERSQLDPDDLTGILNGDREASTNTIYLLAGALDVDPADLLHGMTWSPPSDGGSGYAIKDQKPH